MPKAAAVFSLRSQSAADSWVHGRALAQGGAQATASLHRGIDLSAGVDFSAGLGADVSQLFDADIGVSASADLGAAVAFPIDLFDEAGIIAQFEAKAEAAAYIDLKLTLTFDAFSSLLAGKLKAPWKDLLPVFLDGVGVSAGFWAGVSATAEAQAAAVLTGNLIPLRDGSTPGFTFHTSYGYGYGFGVGAYLIANLDLPDVTGMFDHLTDAFIPILETRLATMIAGLPAADAAAANQAMPFLKMLLPLGARSLFQVANALAPSNTGNTVGNQTATAQILIDSFALEVQQYLLQSLGDLAFSRFKGFLAQIQNAPPSLADQEVQQAKDALAKLKTAFAALENLPDASIGTWATAVQSLLDPLWSVLGTPLLSAFEEEWRPHTAMLWSAASLVEALADWSKTGAGLPDLSGAAPLPQTSEIATFVAGQLGKPAGQALALADLAEFLLLRDWASELATEFPDTAGQVVTWLKTTLGSFSQSPLLTLLFKELSALSGASSTQLRAILKPAIDSLITGVVLPKLIVPLAAKDADYAEFCNRVIKPSLLALSEVLFTGVAELDGSDDSASALREQISAILMQSISRFVLTSFDVLSDHALSEGATLAHSVATDIRNSKAADVYNDVCAVLVGVAWLGLVIPNTDDVANLLDLAADVMTTWSAHNRTSVIAMMGTLIDMGFSTGGSLDQVYALADSPDSPSDTGALMSLGGQILIGSLPVLLLVAERIPAIVAGHLLALAKPILEGIEAGASLAVKAVTSAVALGEALMAQLAQELAKLGTELLTLAGNIAGQVAQLASRALALENQIITAVHDYGAALIHTALDDLELGGGEIEKTADDLYDDAFKVLRTILDAPLTILRDVATWIHDTITTLVAGGSVTRQNVINAVRHQIVSAAAADLSLNIKIDLVFTTVDLGAMMIPAWKVLGLIADVVLGDDEIGNAIDGLTASLTSAATTQSRYQLALQTSNQAALPPAMVHEAGLLLSNQRLTPKVLLPETSATDPSAGTSPQIQTTVYTDAAPLQISIQGANYTYAQTTMGVPRRIRLYFNGKEYIPQDWEWVDKGQNQLWFEATLIPSTTSAIPQNTWQTTINGPVLVPMLFRRTTPPVTPAPSGTNTPNPAPPANVTPPKPAPVLPVPPAKLNLTTTTTTVTGLDLQHLVANPGLVALKLPQPAISVASVHPYAIAQTSNNSRPIVLRPGLNTVQVLVTSGDGQSQQSLSHFYLNQKSSRPAGPARYIGQWSKGTGNNHFSGPIIFDTFFKVFSYQLGQGLVLTSFDTMVERGTRYFIGTWGPAPAAGATQIMLMLGSAADFMTQMTKQAAAGLYLTDFRIYMDSGTQVWAGVWSKGSGPQTFLLQDSWQAVTQMTVTLMSHGLRPGRVRSYMDGGTRKFAVLWTPGTSACDLAAPQSWQNFSAAWQQHKTAGLQLIDLLTFSDNGVRSFAGLFRTGPDPSPITGGTPWSGFESRWSRMTDQQLRLTGITGYSDESA